MLVSLPKVANGRRPREALGLQWVPTIVAAALGGLVQFVITVVILGLALGLFELGVEAVGKLSGS